VIFGVLIEQRSKGELRLDNVLPAVDLGENLILFDDGLLPGDLVAGPEVDPFLYADHLAGLGVEAIDERPDVPPRTTSGGLLQLRVLNPHVVSKRQDACYGEIVRSWFGLRQDATLTVGWNRGCLTAPTARMPRSEL
jgi:hypothetical protein